MKYYNLHCHSHFSVLDSVVKIEDSINFCKANSLKALCFTEHGTLSSAYRLWDNCNKEGIKPVLGLEAYYVDDILKDEGLQAGAYSHMVLICQNELGWRNLKELQSLAWQKGFYKKPRICFNMLKEHSEGLICTTACLHGLIGAVLYDSAYFELLNNSVKNKIINNRIKKFKDLFGDNFYLEIMLNEIPEQVRLNKRIIKLSRKYDIPIIVTTDSHYVYKEDANLQDIVRCVAFKKELSDENAGLYDARELYFATYKDLLRFRKHNHRYIPVADLKNYVKNSFNIVKSIKKYKIRSKKSALPSFSNNAKEYLLSLCNEGAEKLFDNFEDRYQERLDYELGVINKLGMADYFLIVWDIAQESRRRNIPFNTRGSVAGSLVAYLIGISWIDPIKFNTTFERFLTEDRISLPDIDMDFGKTRREELIEYLKEKYGKDSVAHIVNFSIFKPKGAIKDVSRVYGLPFSYVNRITKLIPDKVEEWKDIPNIAEINEFFEKYPYIAEYAKDLIGVSRHRGVHASGVVVTPGRIVNWVPIAWSIKGEQFMQEKVTEFDMYDLEDMDILKLDFLGQNTLDVIQKTVEIIDGDIRNFDELFRMILKNLDDKKVYKNIRTGNLVGTFQMGTSEGMRNLIKQLKPTKIEDIVASISLHRSAILSIGAHEKYIGRKFGISPIEYIHPKMESVLKDTYGILLYQEQVSSLAVHLAGFTVTQSDNFRKGIKRKEGKIFEKWEKQFITGCEKHSNIDKETAEEIWSEIVEWSGYGFNRCIEENQLVLTANGEKKIKDITDEDYLVTHDVEDESFHYDKIKEKHNTGVQEVYEIELESGEVIQSTLKHKFLCHDGEFRTLENILKCGYKIGKINSCMC